MILRFLSLFMSVNLSCLEPLQYSYRAGYQETPKD